MRIGVPKEIKAEENRVAVTPAGVAALVAHGHSVLVEAGAGLGSGMTDAEYRVAGARILRRAADLWARVDLVVKVKEPQSSEYGLLRPGLTLFTYLHLAASRELTLELARRGVTALAYETIALEDGSLPLLAPMSEVAGRLSLQVGAWCLQKPNGGSGILISGASGVRPARVVVLGAGTAGASAAKLAFGLGAQVSVIDSNPGRLRYLHDILGGHLTTLMSNRVNIEEEVRAADLVIGAVLVPGARAPRLLSRATLRAMRPGSALVDISIDQGGTAETSRPTSIDAPIYVAEGVVHYCVTNMPAVVPRTSTFALTNATLASVLAVADHGVRGAVAHQPWLRSGVNVASGQITHPGVAAAFRLPLIDPEEALMESPA